MSFCGPDKLMEVVGKKKMLVSDVAMRYNVLHGTTIREDYGMKAKKAIEMFPTVFGFKKNFVTIKKDAPKPQKKNTAKQKKGKQQQGNNHVAVVSPPKKSNDVMDKSNVIYTESSESFADFNNAKDNDDDELLTANIVEECFYQPPRRSSNLKRSSQVLLGLSDVHRQDGSMKPNSGLFGQIFENTEAWDDEEDSEEENDQSDKNLFLNVSQPLCMVCVGVQGAGKSHTVSVALENCLINDVSGDFERPISSLTEAMCGLVCHFDQNNQSVCEAIGLHAPAQRFLGDIGDGPRRFRGVKRMVILTSPSFYFQRKKFYEGSNFEVYPLLFNWASLKADQIKKLMRLHDGDNQLYVSVMLDLLRNYQRSEMIPVLSQFISEVKKKCDVGGQSAPLKQRLKLLESMIMDSECNANIAAHQVDISQLFDSGTLIVTDLTDTMLSREEANGIFQVVLEQFRNCSKGNLGKVVAFDEAHRYLSKHSGGGENIDGLTSGIVDTVRNMRHENIRVLISTQSPMALPTELLELTSLTVAHHFQSADWYKYLKLKVPFPENGFNVVKGLQQGEALVVCTKMSYSAPTSDGGASSDVLLKMRPRFTVDYGSTKEIAQYSSYSPPQQQEEDEKEMCDY